MEDSKPLKDAWSDHSRLWENNIWVYPVISRRAEGLSIGINLNLDKICSFDCVYCQVDRKTPGPPQRVDIAAIQKELKLIIGEYESNGLASFTNFSQIDASKRQIKDIALSGDGEPTMIKEFTAVCKMLLEVQENYSQYNLKLTLITNSTLLNQKRVQEGLRYLTQKNGEIWAKLDAGSEEWFQKINISPYHLKHIQKKIEEAILQFPIKIQSMWCSYNGELPSSTEIDLYINRVQNIYFKNPKNFLGVQLYTVVRQTARPNVLSVPKEFMEHIAQLIQKEIPVNVKIYE